MQRVANYVHSFQNAYSQFPAWKSCASLRLSFRSGTESSDTHCNLLPMTRGGYLHLPGVSEVLLDVALLSTDSGRRREVVHRQDTQWCHHSDSERLFVTVVFGVVGGKSALGILTDLKVPKGSAMTTQVLRYRGDRGARAVSPPSSSTEWGVCWRRRSNGPSRVVIPA